jgi:hypothetical protein
MRLAAAGVPPGIVPGGVAMDLGTLLNLITTLAVVAGLVFAGLQIRDAERARAAEQRLVLVRSFESPDFMRAMKLIMDLPDGLSMAEVDARSGDGGFTVYYWLGAMETMGILVHHRHIDLELVDDFFSGPLLITWRRLERYVRENRQAQQRDTMHEWFEWLVDRMRDRETRHPPVPASVGEAGWREQGP